MTYNNKRTLVLGLMSISLLSFAIYCLGYFYFHLYAPAEPNSSTGVVYAVGYHGQISYVNKATYFTWRSLGLPSFWLFAVACYLDHKWLITRPAKGKALARRRKS